MHFVYQQKYSKNLPKFIKYHTNKQTSTDHSTNCPNKFLLDKHISVPSSPDSDQHGLFFESARRQRNRRKRQRALRAPQFVRDSGVFTALPPRCSARRAMREGRSRLYIAHADRVCAGCRRFSAMRSSRAICARSLARAGALTSWQRF